MAPKQLALFLLSPIVLTLPFVSLSVHAQDVPRLALTVTEKLPVAAGLVRSTATSRPACDGAGNVYIQIFAPAPAQNMARSVTRISSDGQRLTQFSLDSVRGLAPDATIDSFLVTPRGEVFIFGYNGDDIDLFTFHDDGRFGTIRKFDRGKSFSLILFPTGEFLVRRAAEAFSQAMSPDDGNVYLLGGSLLHSPKPLSVDVLSPGGEILRHLTLQPPSVPFQVGNMKVAGGKIVVEFLLNTPGDRQNRISNFTYSVFDAETGEKQYNYYWPAAPEGFLACYTPNYFTFLKVGENGLTLVRAPAR